MSSKAVEKRHREFAGGRTCARRALAQLGVWDAAIPVGDRGCPVWPGATTGSITHCDGYWAAAVARRADVLAIGIDAETAGPLPAGVLARISRPEELAWLATAPEVVAWDRLLFSAKESVYKAWFPLARCWLGFEDVTAHVDVDAGAFVAEVDDAVPSAPGVPRRFEGRFALSPPWVLTAVVVPKVG